ncbi:MAG: sulfurtransferase TusA family protein [Chloroflexi bacterium]|jgi:tRNA 2-thiouridine synthesizing protein A|nr:sulfurtransferase TusA family protein [Chloroflexota bacterium]MBT7081237.1 sulfurtransferase TusA family protein [Chloroflexota bacterium]MBT7289944.1 sulfurtransferase TusA family protein [Chloroflexota bacterium]
MKADQSLDCMGLYCPMPIYETSMKIKELKVGEVLEVIADDQGIIKDMPAWAETTGNEFLGFEDDGEEIKVYVKKTK